MKSTRWIYCLLILACLMVAISSDAAKLILENNREIIGMIESETADEVVFLTMDGIQLRLPRSSIKEIIRGWTDEDMGETTISVHGDATPTPIPIIEHSRTFIDRTGLTRTRYQDLLSLGHQQTRSHHRQHTHDPSDSDFFMSELMPVESLQPDEPPRSVDEPVARVDQQTGTVKVQRDQHWYDLEPDSDVFPGDLISSIMGTCSIVSNNNAEWVIAEGSRVLMTLDGFELLSGKAWVKTTAPEQIQVLVPASRIDCGHGIVAVEVFATGSRISVLEGSGFQVSRIISSPAIVAEDLAQEQALLLNTEGQKVSLTQLDATEQQQWLQIVAASQPTAQRFTEHPEDYQPAIRRMTGETPDQMDIIASAIQDFVRDTNSWPQETEPALIQLFENPGIAGWRGPYLEGLPPLKDQWGTDFQYALRRSRASGQEYAELHSFGPNQIDDRGRGDDLRLVVTPP